MSRGWYDAGTATATETAMTVRRAFLIVAGSAFLCGLIGAGLGLTLGTFSPGYYRTVFRYGNSDNFNPVEVGVGLGLSQGVIAGLVVGCVVVLAVAWYESRRDSILRSAAGPNPG